MNAPQVVVEIHVTGGLPSFSIVGLPDAEVRESRDRVRSAIQMVGFNFPARRITVNLAPADLPKTSGRYDLAIALGILGASGLIKVDSKVFEQYEIVGELALDGALRGVDSILPMACGVKKCARTFILPLDNIAEAQLIKNLRVIGATNLKQVIDYIIRPSDFVGNKPPIVATDNLDFDDSEDFGLDFAQVRGNLAAKKALEIAACGRHSILLIGNPGCGKSMLANRMSSILPKLTEDEALENAAIYSLAYGKYDFKQWGIVPFRAPHHTSSIAAIIGGGSNPKPGEISLAHNGVLFLDELPEFNKRALESLREPLETKTVSIARAKYKLEFPADFQLIAAMNPCPCGNKGNPKIMCKCGESQVISYTNRVSGPLLDRIDLMVNVPNISYNELSVSKGGESSRVIKQRVIMARNRQLKRQNKLNYLLSNTEVEELCCLSGKMTELLSKIMDKFGLSNRSYYKLLKVARTIADLAERNEVVESDVALATQYKTFMLN
jgi:magnesium chelatase family protein